MTHFRFKRKTSSKIVAELYFDDKTPSQLLKEMRDFAAVAFKDDILQQLWMEQMSNNIKPFLITSNILHLNTIACNEVTFVLV